MSIKDRFSRAVAGIFTEKPRLPYAYVLDIFGFSADHYRTERHKEWDLRQYLGIQMARADSYGPGRVFYSDPEDKIVVGEPSAEPSIHAPKAPATFLASPAIMAYEDRTEFGKSLMVAIRDRVDTPDDPFKTLVFGLYGTRKKDGHIKFHKILVPDLDGNGDVKRLRKIDLSDKKDVTRALSYAHLCVQQLLNGETLDPAGNMYAVLQDPPPVGRLPWKNKGPKP